MMIIKANITSIENVQVKFIEENNKILDVINYLNDELNTIGNIVNTPKSNEVVPEFVAGLKEYEQLIQKNNEVFDTYFKSISKEYNEFLNDVKKKVGGNQ